VVSETTDATGLLGEPVAWCQSGVVRREWQKRVGHKDRRERMIMQSVQFHFFDESRFF